MTGEMMDTDKEEVLWMMTGEIENEMVRRSTLFQHLAAAAAVADVVAAAAVALFTWKMLSEDLTSL